MESTASTLARRSCATPANYSEQRDGQGGWLDWLRPTDPGDHPAFRTRAPRAPHPRGRRDARRDIPDELTQAQGRGVDRAEPSMVGSPPRRRGHAAGAARPRGRPSGLQRPDDRA